MKSVNKYYAWGLWLFIVITLSAYLGFAIKGEDSTVFLPGETTHGHYQIELACNVCHTDFEGVKQNACLQCHEEELNLSQDSHPAIKFSDPRNASRVELLDARQCVTCHVEHKPDTTHAMGVSLPLDYCYYCHQDIADERPSHTGMGFDTCATAGCHNFHDNRALYEDFLLKHLDEPDFRDIAKLVERSYYKEEVTEAVALTQADHDAPADKATDADILHAWFTTKHAQAGVNCTDCHNETDSVTRTTKWVDKPSHDSCQSCHKNETKSFLEGRHGMRLAQGLSPMTPGMARIPMKAEAAHRELSCISCHGAHDFDTKHAAAEACMSCHNDEHTQQFVNSKHYELWERELSGEGQPGTGVSCATCHMPRTLVKEFNEEKIVVEHNQNATLRPNEKMIRPSCLSCHGLGFSIDALADETLIRNNFQGRPSKHIESLDMAKDRQE